MFPYISNTENEQKEMLGKIGVKNLDGLFSNIPSDLIIDSLNLPTAMSELEVTRKMTKLANENKTINELTCFLGAGSYDHYIPSVCAHIISKPEFFTAYTPYQPEISQGTLQSVFEYQSMICELTGMDVATISMYDSSTALSEAAVMALEATKRQKVIVSATVSPSARKLLKTYAHYRGYEVVEAAEENGITDVANLKNLIDKDTAAVIISYPNFFGIIEDVKEIESLIHAQKGLLILSVDPISLGVLKSPKEMSADIVVGDCQCFGGSLNFGGPYLGILNTTTKLMRKMAGRIIGETVDVDGNRGFVLTLQTREQHIRREKATSNICSDQTLMAINASVYLSTLGKEGIKEVGTQCILKANYAYESIIKSTKFKPLFDKPFFKEFVVTSDIPYEKVNAYLYEKGIMCGYDLSIDYPKYKNAIMFSVTEKRSKEEIDALVKALEVIA